MEESTSLKSFLHQSSNSHCAECQLATASFFLSDFGVFLCQQCTDVVRSLAPQARIRTVDSSDNLDLAAAAVAGNERFRLYFAGSADVRERFSSSRSDFYQRSIRSEVYSQGLLGKAGERQNATGKVASWLARKLTPLVVDLSERAANSEVLQRLGKAVEDGYAVYEAQVREHVLRKSGFLHPVKATLDSISRLMDDPEGKSEVEMLELHHSAEPVPPHEPSTA